MGSSLLFYPQQHIFNCFILQLGQSDVTDANPNNIKSKLKHGSVFVTTHMTATSVDLGLKFCLFRHCTKNSKAITNNLIKVRIRISNRCATTKSNTNPVFYPNGFTKQKLMLKRVDLDSPEKIQAMNKPPRAKKKHAS